VVAFARRWEYQPSARPVKGSKIFGRVPSRSREPFMLSLCMALEVLRTEPLTAPARAVIGAYRVKPSAWETPCVGAVMNSKDAVRKIVRDPAPPQQ
jgi:hypothetical protein